VPFLQRHGEDADADLTNQEELLSEEEGALGPVRDIHQDSEYAMEAESIKEEANLANMIPFPVLLDPSKVNAINVRGSFTDLTLQVDAPTVLEEKMP
jgi:hypothetical protein